MQRFFLYKTTTYTSMLYLCTRNIIMKGHHIGELEELVLLTVGSLYGKAYAVEILKVIKENTHRVLDVTAIHAVLRRLEVKGYVSSSMGGATNERGGRRKRFFVLTQAGRLTLDEIMNVRTALYSKITSTSFADI